MNIKLVGWKRGDKSHYNKTDVIVRDGQIIGEVEFAYGRSDSSDRWNVWEYVIRLPLKNLFVKVRTGCRASYTVEKGRAIENINRLLNGAEPTWKDLANAFQGTERVAPDYEAYGTCVGLTARVRQGFDKLEAVGEGKVKTLKFPLHQSLSTPSTLLS